MRHRLSRLRLRYKPAHSRVLQRNLVTSLLLYESVRTTKKRAEVVQPIIDRIITTAKTKRPHVAIRAINAIVLHENACRKTMEVFKQRYAGRSSGFTRIVPLGSRAGDGAKTVLLQLIDAAGVEGGGSETGKRKEGAERKEKAVSKNAGERIARTSSASSQ